MSCIYKYENKDYTKEELIIELATNRIDVVNSKLGLNLENSSKVVEIYSLPYLKTYECKKRLITGFVFGQQKLPFLKIFEFVSMVRGYNSIPKPSLSLAPLYTLPLPKSKP